jgi:alanine-synthesizing transaminase
MFSARIPGDLRPNAIALARRGAEVPFDLTVSNPTVCGIVYPETLLTPLARPAGLVYRPEPMGIESARRAVAADWRRHGAEVDPGRIVITASSSEAYAFLFKLLCDPGDAVMVPAPSYPLFEHLAALDGVRAVPYRLDPSDGWQPSLPAGFPERTRAVLAVHPNNPTGSYVEPAAADALALLCSRRGLALIVDEVFLDYPLVRIDPAPTFAARADALTFTLGGLSKSLGLPQVKLSWIAVSGPDEAVEEALRRLEFVADNYLSVGTPIQLALPLLLTEAAPVRNAIRERCRRNLDALRAAASPVPAISAPAPQGGWSAVLRFPSTIGEESLALELLQRDGVAVHPGYFFDFPGDGYVVVSLLPEPGVFAEGARRLLHRIASKV